MTALMFFQQLHMLRRNMPPSAMTGPMAQQQQIMLYVFPLMYAVGGISIPIGVLIYWLTSNVWTMAQQYFIIRNYPTPDTPAYVEWEERMRAQGKDPREIERQRIERGRRKPVAKPTPAAVDENNRPVVARQRTATRQTVRAEPDGMDHKKVVQRQQPINASRAKRKR
jgi:YidC/Oxa1 family membrane protein insertase